MSRFYGQPDLFGNRLQGVGNPTDPGDGVPKRFIRYDWQIGCVGKPLAGEIFPYFPVPTPFTIPAGMVNSLAEIVPGIGAMAAANAVFNLNRVAVGASSAVSIGTLTFAPNSMLGTFSMSSDTAIARGDILFWQAPATQDTALSDFGIVVAGVR